jgi:DNA-binding NtrC family response regulator
MPNNARQVLIVDDNQDVRTLIKVTLVNQGYDCHTADGAEAALAILKRNPVDLALIDVIMPGMTGLSLFRQIKRIYPETAIIFVTSVDDMSLAFGSVKEGAYDYLIKSKIPHRLVETIEQALGWRDANIERDWRLHDLQVLADNQLSEVGQKSGGTTG